MEKGKVSNNFGKWSRFMILYAGISYYIYQGAVGK